MRGTEGRLAGLTPTEAEAPQLGSRVGNPDRKLHLTPAPPPPIITRRDQEVVASKSGGPKLFVRISGLATPPCSLFVDLVVELYSTGASSGSPPPAGV